MRSTLLVVLSCLVIAAGFGLYFVTATRDTQSKANPAARVAPLAATLPTTSETVIGAGDRVWWERFDKDTLERTSRFRVDRYEPHRDDRVMVIRPIVDFFLAQEKQEDGTITQQVIRIVGERGIISMEEGFRNNRTSIAAGMPSQTPRSGELHNVTLYMYDSLEEAEEHLKNLLGGSPSTIPRLTLVTPNASFDSETFRVASEPYIDDDGLTVAADRVPVTVVGDEYEFDGQGLELQYNQRDRRLEYLRIAHGKRLKILKPGKFLDPAEKRPPATRPAAISAFPALPLPGFELASADNLILAQAPVSPPPQRRRREPATGPTTRPKLPDPVYRATFKDDVRVTQADQTIALAKTLQIDFLQDADEESKSPTTAPALTPSPGIPGEGRGEGSLPSAQALDRAPATRPARQRTGGLARQTRVDAPASQPSTKPADPPIEIFWTGPLEIAPLRTPRPERIAPRESILRLIGDTTRPAELFRVAEDVRSHLTCAVLTHWTLDSGVQLDGAEGLPVQMTDSRGTHIVTPSMVYSEAEQIVNLVGPSRASLPLDSPATQPATQPAAPASAKPALLEAQWTDRCILMLEGGGLEEMIVRRANLYGDVHVTHPDLNLSSRSLALLFAPDEKPVTRPATTRPSREMPPLREMHAEGQVACLMRGPEGPQDVRTVHTEDLRLLTARSADGRLYARRIDASGDVIAQDPKQRMSAGFVSLVLLEPKPKPATQPATQPAASEAPATRPAKKKEFDAGDLQFLEARQNVHVVTADGKTAEADRMTIDGQGEEPLVTLFGAPIAKVTHEANVLTGPTIRMKANTQELHVDGPGKLVGVQGDEPLAAAASTQPATRPAARPVEVVWQTSLRAEGRNNLVEALGDVKGRSVDEDGSVNTFAGQRIMMVMMPTTRPATQPASPAAPTTAPAATTRPASGFDALGDRQVRSIVLQDRAVVTSTLSDADGNTLRLFHVDSELIHYDRDQRKLNIPQAGRMLFIDERPPSTQPAAREAARDPMGVRGRTVFEWKRSLVYDEAANLVTMLGNVVIAREPQQPGGAVSDPLRVDADRVLAHLAPVAAPATQPTTRPVGALGSLSPRMQLKHVVAQAPLGGVVQVTHGKKLNVDASRIEYDPVTHVLSVFGTPGQFAKWRDEKGFEQATFLELHWNTETSNIISQKDWRVRSLR